MRTIDQAQKDCCAAWDAQPGATHGWNVHHEIEWEKLTEPIAKRIEYILSSKPKNEQVCRLDNLRPISAPSLAIVFLAGKTYAKALDPSAQRIYYKAAAAVGEAGDKATAEAWKTYYQAAITARKAYDEAAAPAHRADVPNNTWNGISIFKRKASW
jgi:hypothetical protein